MTPEPPAHLSRVLWDAREAAFPAGEFVGQESFVTAGQVLALARHGIEGTGARVLDLCCGVGGPGLLVARELGCGYLGVDADRDSIATARERAARAGVPAVFAVRRVPPVPRGPFDAVLLFETVLAFRDKDALLSEVARALRPRGRLVLTVEEGSPLTGREQRLMPGSDTVWPVTRSDLTDSLERCGLRVVYEDDLTRAHAEVAGALADSYAGLLGDLAGPELETVSGLVVAHRLWSEWLGSRRIRKLAVVAERVG